MHEPGTRGDDDELLRRVRELEARLARLEQRLELSAAPDRPMEAGPPQVALVESVSIIPELGRAVLAMAGAYVLRALTESHSLPAPLGVFSGIAYAVFWLVRAAHLPAGRGAQTVVYSLTSALICGPLLWEAVLRLNAISTRTAAAVLLVFTVTGLLISWRKSLLAVATISILTAVLTGAALLIGAHDVVPFMLLLLLIAAAVEISACFDHWLSGRWLAAAAADLVVLLATYLITDPHGLPESYAPIPRWSVIAAQLALPGIYLASTIVRSRFRSAAVSVFEAGQIAAAFLIAAGGGFRLGSTVAAAVLCLTGALACYVVSALTVQGRDSQIFGVFGFLLTVAGLQAGLPPEWAAAVASGLAVAFLFAGRPVLRWHGGAYLAVAVVFSGALAQSIRALLGDSDDIDSLPALVAGTAVALVCLVAAFRARPGQRVLRVGLAGVTFWLLGAAGAIAFAVSFHALFGGPAPHAYCGSSRTAILSGGAVLLGWIGSRRADWETAPLVYPMMILGAYRLLLVDLRQDNKAALVISLLVYGTALVLLPRLLKPRQTMAS